MNPFCIPHADQVGHIALFQLQQFKERAKECLRHEDFGNAFHYYNEAVKHCNVFAHFPNVQEEQPKLLSNRSMVLSKTGHFELALTDAQQCIGMKPFWEKGYWRAATAYKGLNNMYEALNMLIQGYNATLPQRNQGIIIDFLQEIIITIIDPLVNRYQGDCYFLLANLEHNIESLGAEVQEKILQRLASSQQWEGISLLVTGVHRGPESVLDYSFTNVSAEKISVGCLLKDLSITDLKGYGMQLAAALLKNGASYQDIELKWGSPVLHVVLVKTLETGNEELMKLILRKYLDTQDKKNVVDTYGHSALHVITQFRPCCEERNKLLSICIESGCNAFIFDKSEKLSIDYCEPNDKCFESLSRIFGDTDAVRKHVVGLKEKGNAAKEEKQYEQALLYYSRAINLSTRCDSLQRDSAILYTNRCTVYSEQNNLQEAIKDAELAIKIDNTWIKGHWRKTQLLRRIGQNLEAFSAAVVGLSISEVAQKEKCELVVECVKSFQYLTDSEKKEKYTTFSDIPVQFWPSVLQKLSKETEWLCIKQLVLGIEQNNDEVKGIARDTDFSTIRYDNLFAFIIGQHNLETVSSWIVPLIIHITTKPEGSNNLMRFKEWEGDTPLHAAAKFSILTGNAALLRYMEEISKKVNIYDGLKNSPLHSIVKMPRPSQIDIFPEVVEMLLHFGVSADLLDKEGKTAVDYIDQAKYPRIFEILERKKLKAPQTDEESSEKNSQMTENNQGKGSVLTSSNRGKDRSIKREITKNTANPQHQEQVKTCDSLSSNNTTELVTNEFETSKNEGDRMFKERKYESALKSYRKAKEFMKIAKDSEVISIFCKMADCYLNFEQFKKIIEESKHFISFLGNSFQAQFRIGKAYAGLRQHSVAVKTFCIAYGLTNANHDDLLYELAKTYTSCNFKEIPFFNVRNLKGIKKIEWIKIVYRLIENGDWKRAKRIYTDLSRWFENFQHVFDLKVLCNINKAPNHRWIIHFILELLHNGSDFHTLHIERNEPYLHACVRLTLATGEMDLFEEVFNKAKERKEESKEDGQNNTVLHLAVNQITICCNPDFRVFLVQRLLDIGVDPTLLNKQKKTALKCVPKSLKGLADFMRNYESKRQLDMQEKKDERRQDLKTFQLQMKAEKEKRVEQKKLERKRRFDDDLQLAMDKECTSKCHVRLQEAKEYMSLNEFRDTCLKLTDIFQAKHRSEAHHQLVEKGIQLIIHLFGSTGSPDVPVKLTRIPVKLYARILIGLGEKEHWKQMHIASLEFRKHRGISFLQDFAKGFSIEQVIKNKGLHCQENLLLEIMENMLRSGSLISEGGKSEIAVSVQNNLYMVLHKLFDFNADPLYLSMEDGDTPMHAALYIALYRDKGNISILEKFFDMIKKDPGRFPALNPRELNSRGESLFHVLAKAKQNEITLRVTRFLCDKGTESYIEDRDGRLPEEYLRNDDNRLQFFRLASKMSRLDAKEGTVTGSYSKEEQRKRQRNVTFDMERATENESSAPIGKQKLKVAIKKMIDNLNDASLYNEETIMRRKRHSEEQEYEESKEEQEDKVLSDPIEETKAKSSIEKTECELQDEYIEPYYFETQEWELECTVDVWKKLSCRTTPRSFKIDIIQRLKKLARGELLGSICEKIKLQTIDKSVEIFETGPILWEIAICFSQRLTESSSTLNNVLYTELIRIWDIFTDEKGKRESLERITTSCRKGEECLIEKYLTCSETLDCKYDKGRRIPRRFIRYSSQESKPNTTKEKLLLPASHFAKEYHVLKFYFFSTDMAVCALDPRENAKDFPFKVTEKEHAIINLSSAGPLLLMGRSGTGKTTCCLYRLWSQYDQHNKTVIEYEENQADDEDNSKQTSSTAQMCEKDQDNDVRNPVEYGLIRQIFITKNLVLCNEVRKTFYGIQNASSFESGRTTRVGITLPSRFQDLQNVHFPIFTTSRKLLLMIDASLPNPFFRRDEQGNIKADIPGWTNENESLEFLASIDDDSDIELDESMNEEQNYDADNIEVNRMSDVRREVTYDIFVNLVWPKINKGMDNYHPSLIWMEIISFIKGSFEALSAKHGHLSKSDYFEQGRKKAPNFTGERETVYEIFLRYRHYLKQHFMFDETDVVRHIFKRMNRVDRDLWNIQQIYVDETQDFTQAELYLLLNLCRSPNNIFMTGDTAQCIMRGICFRFEDLCSLFYHAKNSRIDFEKVLIPKKVHQLTHNYRSHNGILSLASSILDILAKYYPESFDILEKDKGLFQGPSPILLESCSIQDVATMLATGKKQSTSNIEFGAHQAILVVNDESRDSLPEELQHGIVLTIYEAKGLEFDDILLYNFFKDSQAGKEWRVVTSFLDELISEENEHTSEDEIESFVELDYDAFKEKQTQSRPLQFDPIKHKALNTELKHLYTAVTRARVHVWIFDADKEKRAPMFEYFRARKMAKNTTESKEAGVFMHAEDSTPEDWFDRGMELMEKSVYKVAAICFSRGNDLKMAKIANSHQKAQEAMKLRGKTSREKEMKEMFLSAAYDFLKCEMPSKAAKCLEFAKEYSLLATLFENTNQLEKAADAYEINEDPIKASECLEEIGKYRQAIHLLCAKKQFEVAIECLHRYMYLKQTYERKNEPFPDKLLKNSPTPFQTVIQLSQMAAKQCHLQGDVDKMMSFLQQIPDLGYKIDFLAERNRTEEAISLLKSPGNERLLIDFYLKCGQTENALKCAENIGDGELRNLCLFEDCYSRYCEGIYLENIQSEICKKLIGVLHAMQDSQDKVLAGKVALLIGKISEDQEYVQIAYGEFNHCRPNSNLAGQQECMDWMIYHSDLRDKGNQVKCILGMETLFKALSILIYPINESERQRRVDVLEYFGYHKTYGNSDLTVYPSQKPMALKISLNIEKSRDHKCQVKLEKTKNDICRYLIQRGEEWIHELEGILRKQKDDLLSEFINSNPMDSDLFLNLIQMDILLVELEAHVRTGSKNFKRRSSGLGLGLKKLDVSTFDKCKDIMLDLFPDDGIVSISNFKPGEILKVLKYIRKVQKGYFRQAMKSFLDSMADEMKSDVKHNHILYFVSFLFIRDIFDVRTSEDPETILLEMEEAYMNETDCESPHWRVSHGFEISENQEHGVKPASLCRYMVSCQKLLKSGKPIEALLEFSKFCQMLCQQDISPLSNSPHLMYWLEFFSCLALFSTAAYIGILKSKECQFILPKSYPLNAVSIYMTFHNKDTLIQDLCKKKYLQKYGSDLLKSPECIVQLLERLTDRPVSYLKLEGNQAQENQKHAFLERLLKLCLILFCNVRNEFHSAADIEEMLACKVYYLNRKMEILLKKKNKLPENLQNIQFTEPENFRKMLLFIVYQESNDELQEHTWSFGNFQISFFDIERREEKRFLSPNTEIKIKSTESILRTKHKTGALKTLPCTKALRTASLKSGRLSCLEEDTQETVLYERDSKVDMKQSNSKETPIDTEGECAKTIVKYFRYVLLHKRAPQISELLKEKLLKKKMTEINSLLGCSNDNTYECQVCGCPLYSPTGDSERKDSVIILSYSDEEQTQERITTDTTFNEENDVYDSFHVFPSSSKAEKPDYPFELLLRSDFSKEERPLENIKEHYESLEHRKKENEYEAFKLMYCNEIYDTIKEIERFIKKHKIQNEEFSDRFENISFYTNSLCKKVGQLNELVNHIAEAKDWGNSHITEILESVRHNYDIVKDHVKSITEQEKKKRKELRNQRRLGSSGKEDEDHLHTKKKKKKMKVLQKFTFSSSSTAF